MVPVKFRCQTNQRVQALLSIAPPKFILFYALLFIKNVVSVRCWSVARLWRFDGGKVVGGAGGELPLRLLKSDSDVTDC